MPYLNAYTQLCICCPCFEEKIIYTTTEENDYYEQMEMGKECEQKLVDLKLHEAQSYVLRKKEKWFQRDGTK